MQTADLITQKQPWIGRAPVDIIFILLPPFFCLLIIMLFPSVFANSADMPIAGWVILILLVDVAHVYSTLYRTYFDPKSFGNQKILLWLIPFAGFVAGAVLYSFNPLYFWRILAYVAVYHFIRQQYGFMRIYSRRETHRRIPALIDKIMIYTATIYPILYWHLSGPRNFSWFIEEDFIFYQSDFLLLVFRSIYWIILMTYIVKEVWMIIRTHYVNIPRIAVITGTTISWYFGIVYFNGDLAFTLLNVVSHGIPYMALIWLYGKKKYTAKSRASSFLKLIFSRYGVIIFLALLFVFAFVEEGLWDLGVWNEHKTIFGTNHLADIQFSHPMLSIIVPLLALPQVTHYILDGFIWKIKKEEYGSIKQAL